MYGSRCSSPTDRSWLDAPIRQRIHLDGAIHWPSPPDRDIENGGSQEVRAAAVTYASGLAITQEMLSANAARPV